MEWAWDRRKIQTAIPLRGLQLAASLTAAPTRVALRGRALKRHVGARHGPGAPPQSEVVGHALVSERRSPAAHSRQALDRAAAPAGLKIREVQQVAIDLGRRHPTEPTNADHPSCRANGHRLKSYKSAWLHHALL